MHLVASLRIFEGCLILHLQARLEILSHALQYIFKPNESFLIFGKSKKEFKFSLATKRLSPYNFKLLGRCAD